MVDTYRIKANTIPKNLAGRECRVIRRFEDSDMVHVYVPNEGSYKFLEEELEKVDG